MTALHSILVPVDGSPPSIAALDHAITLADEGEARIDVLYVLTADPARDPTDVEGLIDAAIERARARLGPRISQRTVSGDPVQMIVETARTGHYDLVVLGTHGRIGRLHAMLGSVAEGVVRNAPCPVLTVRETGGGYQSFAESRHGRPSMTEPRHSDPPR